MHVYGPINDFSMPGGKGVLNVETCTSDFTLRLVWLTVISFICFCSVSFAQHMVKSKPKFQCGKVDGEKNCDILMGSTQNLAQS